MDGSTFDTLSRRLAGASSRRRVLSGLAAILIGGGGTALASGDAQAGRICRLPGHKCLGDAQCCSGICSKATRRSRIRKCICPAGFAPCRGTCVELGTEEHCLACGDACPGEQVCFSDTGCACPTGSPCGETCVDLIANFAQCGTCDTPCDPVLADSCTGGECMCGETPACADGFTCSEGKCLRTPCMPYSMDCLIGVDGTILLHAGDNFQWIGLTTNGAGACATDSDCQGAGCVWPICRCGVERWVQNGETRAADTGGPGYCVMGSNLPPV